jgi:transcriptional regulator with XRE-family HTH domain
VTNSEFRQLRTTAGIPQHEVAYRAGMDRTRIVLWERGHLELRAEELTELEGALFAIIAEHRAKLSALLTERKPSAAAV